MLCDFAKKKVDKNTFKSDFFFTILYTNFLDFRLIDFFYCDFKVYDFLFTFFDLFEAFLPTWLIFK